jgi:hypothetical protein
MLIALYPIGTFVGIAIGLVLLGLTRIVVLGAFAAAFVTFILALSQSQPAAIVISPWLVILLGLLASLPDALKLIRAQGGLGAAFKAWRGGREE